MNCGLKIPANERDLASVLLSRPRIAHMTKSGKQRYYAAKERIIFEMT